MTIFIPNIIQFPNLFEIPLNRARGIQNLGFNDFGDSSSIFDRFKNANRINGIFDPWPNDQLDNNVCCKNDRPCKCKHKKNCHEKKKKIVIRIQCSKCKQSPCQCQNDRNKKNKKKVVVNI